MKKILFALLALMITSACLPVVQPSAPTPTPTETSPPVIVRSEDNPFAPNARDLDLQRGQVFISFASVFISESHPEQITLGLNGSLPTPCHQLRVKVLPLTTPERVDVEVYSVTQIDTLCAQVLLIFGENVPLGVFPPGSYTLFVNGQAVGTFNQ